MVKSLRFFTQDQLLLKNEEKNKNYNFTFGNLYSVLSTLVYFFKQLLLLVIIITKNDNFCIFVRKAFKLIKIIIIERGTKKNSWRIINKFNCCKFYLFKILFYFFSSKSAIFSFVYL